MLELFFFAGAFIPLIIVVAMILVAPVAIYQLLRETIKLLLELAQLISSILLAVMTVTWVTLRWLATPVWRYTTDVVYPYLHGRIEDARNDRRDDAVWPASNHRRRTD